MADRILFNRKLELRAPIERVWAVLSDTNALNRALGLPPIIFTAPADATLMRRAAAKGAGGIPLSWDEPPFEWIEGQFYSVRRGGFQGPIGTPREIFSGVKLFAGKDATQIELFMDTSPVNILGGLLSKSSIGEKALDNLEKLCRDLEARIKKTPKDPFPPNAVKAKVNLDRLEQSFQALRGQVPGKILDLLTALIKHAPEEDLLQMRPFILADRWGADRMEVLRAFLRAARLGALDVSWVILCPCCRAARAEYSSLSNLRSATQCPLCSAEFRAEFDHNVEVRFSVNRSIRKAVSNIHCIGGPGNTPHRYAQVAVCPGRPRVVRAKLPPERFYLRSMRGKSRALLLPDPDRGESVLRASFAGDEVHGAELRFKPGEVELVLENLDSSNLPVWAVVDREAWGDDAATAALVTTLQEFRDLFSSEVLAAGEQVHIKSLAILFTDIKNSTALYEKVGDAKAYVLVREHFRILTDVVRKHRGAVVKTLGDAIMAVFLSPEDALACAFAIQGRFHEQNKSRAEGLERIIVKIGIHLGPAIVVNTKDALDYFGTSVNIAARIQTASLGGDIVVSKAITESCREALKRHPHEAQPFEVSLKGLADRFQLWRLTPIAAPAKV